MIRDELIEEAAKAINESWQVQSRTDWEYLATVAARASFKVWAQTLGETPGVRECCESCRKAKALGFTPSNVPGRGDK